MGKRKTFTPKRTNESKRKLLSWNMSDVSTPDTLKETLSPDSKAADNNVSVVTEKESCKTSSTLNSSSNNRLDNLIKQSHFYLTIKRSIKSSDLSHKFHIGNVKMTLHSIECNTGEEETNPDPPLCDEFYLYVNLESERHLLYYEFTENDENQAGTSVSNSSPVKTSIVYYIAYADLMVDSLASLNNKSFQLVLERYDRNSMEMILNVYLSESSLTHLKFPAEATGKMKKNDRAVHDLICHWYNVQIKDYSELPYIKKHDIEEVLKAIKDYHTKEPPVLRVNVQHSTLKPSLREYQKSGVQWMLGKERFHKENLSVTNTGSTHSLYQEITTLDGKHLYFNKYTGYLCKERPGSVSSPPGGILGDEMGLGKTVEVLACILCHPRTDLPGINPLPVINVIEENQKMKKKIKVSKLPITEEMQPPVSLSEEVQETNKCKESNKISKESNNESKMLETVNTAPSESANVDEKDVGTDSGKKKKNQSRSKMKFVEFVEVNDEENETQSVWTVKDKRQFFECICGKKKEMDSETDRVNDPNIVQCEKCNLWQHAKCVNYDLADPYRGCFLCPHCHASSPPISSGATLIVSPSSICHQWVDEILKHVKKESLNVFVYEGVNKQGYIQPQMLANQDIVLTTYETLRKEIDYVDLPHSNSTEGRKLRQPKRYMATPSPMIAVEWWRICLDEAQMVECTSTKTATMALRLHAVNRWCVTGTPIQRGLEDVYGLLLFLGLDPYWVQNWWKTILYDPFCYGDKEKLISVLGSVLWRTSKKDVLDQISLPLQSENVLTLDFSPVEEHFYKRQYQACSREAMNKLRKYQNDNLRLNDLDRHSLHQLLLPLTKLRQACCHPQAVKGEFMPIHKSMMTMEELLNQLTKKAKLECEEAHRQYVAANNGLAALHLINRNYPEAVELYRDVLRSVEEHKKELRTDDLQQLHAMHNLSEILAAKPEGVAPTLRDSQLSDQCCDIRTKYMQKAENFVTAAHQAWIPAEKTLRELKVEFKDGRTWWAGLIEHFMHVRYVDHLIDKIKEDLADNAAQGVESISKKFRDGKGLLFLLSCFLEELQSTHDKLVTALRKLNNAAKNQEIINETVECCLRPTSGNQDPCPFCKAHEYFEQYEGKLYCFVDKGIETNLDEGFEDHTVHTKRQGSWKDSDVEKVLKTLIHFSKSWGGDRQLIQYGNLHIKIFDALKKEFKAMRTVWIETKANVASVDELDMARTRIRLRLPEEPIMDTPQPNIIEKAEVEQHKMKFTNDKIVGRNDLRKKLGQLLYLTNLSKTQSPIESGKNPEPCPICQRELGCRWSVMHCGHCFCLECMRVMIERYSFGGTNGSMKCPVCRQKTRHADIAYVSTKKQHSETNGFKIKGDHSTKVEGVVKCLLEIQKSDPEAKSLVFSTWQDVLGVLSKALDDNHISYKALNSYKFQANLASFKHEANIKVLLLPIHSGANGLNLTEATHIILVEPILNPAQELQAIGRVHRIGQTRPTFVHRFLVKGTIEQKINSLLQTTQGPSVLNSHNTEETTFTIGDFKALFQEIEYMDIDSDEENGQEQGTHGTQEVEVQPDTSSHRENGQEQETHGTQEVEVQPDTSSQRENGQEQGRNGTQEVVVQPDTSSQRENGQEQGTNGTLEPVVQSATLNPSLFDQDTNSGSSITDKHIVTPQASENIHLQNSDVVTPTNSGICSLTKIDVVEVINSIVCNVVDGSGNDFDQTVNLNNGSMGSSNETAVSSEDSSTDGQHEMK